MARLVDTNAYVTVLRELAKQGKIVSLLISGSSMSPFLCHNRDYIYFTRPWGELKRGDMVFYERGNGQFVMHRVYRVTPEGFYMVGDAQTEIEGPLQKDQIFGQVIKVKRKDKILEPGDFWWEFFAKVWIRIIPLRRPVTALYSIYYRVFHKKDIQEK